MNYKEILPDNIFSHHIESYWSMSVGNDPKDDIFELLLPTCTFNIIFTDQPCFIRTGIDQDWINLIPGASFFGQRNSPIQIKFQKSLRLFGIRFKPFAFANIAKTPIFLLNDKVTSLNQIFVITSEVTLQIQQINKTEELNLKLQLINELMYDFLKNSMSIDEKLRAQLNYIMEKRGSAMIYDLYDEFNVSKVTLRKHFIQKVGLTPKKVSQIWRMNYMLQIKEKNPDENLTSHCLLAGFYDQAHFIKDFKVFFGVTPRKFFKQSTHLVQIAHTNISRRFNNYYDPKMASH